jgi:hypothetical protein
MPVFTRCFLHSFLVWLLKFFNVIETYDSKFCVTANVRDLVKKGKLTQDKAEKTLSMLKGVLDYSDFKEVDMVIEVGSKLILIVKFGISNLQNPCSNSLCCKTGCGKLSTFGRCVILFMLTQYVLFICSLSCVL